jgi:DNA mismatch repair protein PMS2
MIGKTLTHKQMGRVVRNMGTIDKPWNCPHGRPTMRHLFSLRHWEEWNEYDHAPAHGHDENSDEDGNESSRRLDIWKEYLQGMADEAD